MVHANEKFGVIFTPLPVKRVPPVRARRESGRNLASETQDPYLLSSLSLLESLGVLVGQVEEGGKAELPMGEPLRRLCASSSWRMVTL